MRQRFAASDACHVGDEPQRPEKPPCDRRRYGWIELPPPSPRWCRRRGSQRHRATVHLTRHASAPRRGEAALAQSPFAPLSTTDLPSASAISSCTSIPPPRGRRSNRAPARSAVPSPRCSDRTVPARIASSSGDVRIAGCLLVVAIKSRLPTLASEFVTDLVQHRLPKVGLQRPLAARLEGVHSLKHLEASCPARGPACRRCRAPTAAGDRWPTGGGPGSVA